MHAVAQHSTVETHSGQQRPDMGECVASISGVRRYTGSTQVQVGRSRRQQLLKAQHDARHKIDTHPPSAPCASRRPCMRNHSTATTTLVSRADTFRKVFPGFNRLCGPSRQGGQADK